MQNLQILQHFSSWISKVRKLLHSDSGSSSSGEAELSKTASRTMKGCAFEVSEGSILVGFGSACIRLTSFFRAILQASSVEDSGRLPPLQRSHRPSSSLIGGTCLASECSKKLVSEISKKAGKWGREIRSGSPLESARLQLWMEIEKVGTIQEEVERWGFFSHFIWDFCTEAKILPVQKIHSWKNWRTNIQKANQNHFHLPFCYLRNFKEEQMNYQQAYAYCSDQKLWLWNITSVDTTFAISTTSFTKVQQSVLQFPIFI